MKAVILAGGFGTRLKTTIGDVPKPMALFAGKPFLEHQIRFLKDQGIKDIILAVHHKADKIKSFFGTGHRWGVDITYSEEDVPLGTAGAIKNAEKYIDDTFLVLNGDTYSQINFSDLLEFHRSKRSGFSVAVKTSDEVNHYGNVILQDNKITNFAEKLESGDGLINTGIYVFEPKIFDFIEPEKKVSLENEIFPEIAKKGELWGYKFNGYFMDIGRPETYAKFKQDIVDTLILQEHDKVAIAMQKISRSDIDLVLVANEQKKLLGVLNNKLIRNYILGGGTINDSVSQAMVTDPLIAKTSDSKENRDKILLSGTHRLPIVDEHGIIRDVEFHSEKIKTDSYPVVRGKAPLRISFAGGGTDLSKFFESYGGVVINATIDKYCYATVAKRADSKIVINSDLNDGLVIVDNREDLTYDGKFDLIKAIINVVKPEFGFEIHLHNDLPPGRGLGSSATLAVLLIKLLGELQGVNYDDYKIAELAYKAERSELKIKGGWQDQYAAVTGGFSFMEFGGEKTLIYPLRVKEEIINELQEHMFLCYVGKAHNSGEIHQNQEDSFKKNEEEVLQNMHRMKDIAKEIRDCLLTSDLARIGVLLHESWEKKRKLASKISDQKIDELYETGIKNGAYGGKLLGAGGGGYILFYFTPNKRNQLRKALEKAGGEIMDFNFEFKGTQVWNAKGKF